MTKPSDTGIESMTYQATIADLRSTIEGAGAPWTAIDATSAARMKLQNRFPTGLDIARYTAKIMREDMAAYDLDPANYTQSLGCWHGFIGQQKMIAIKKHFGSTKKRYLYLSGWMIAALRSEFGPLPDQSMHEKTSVPALIAEIYTFLRQADARELGILFRDLDKAREAIHAADTLRFAQGARVEVEPFHHLYHDPRRERPLIALDQIEIAGRNRELGSHRGLGQTLPLAQAPQRWPGKDRVLGHCKFLYRFTAAYAPHCSSGQDCL